MIYKVEEPHKEIHHVEGPMQLSEGLSSAQTRSQNAFCLVEQHAVCSEQACSETEAALSRRETRYIMM